MSKIPILEEYRKNVVLFKENAKSIGLSTQEIESLFKESFVQLKKENSSSNAAKPKKNCTNFRNIFVLFIILFIFIYILLNVHQPTSSIVLRNVQGLTYPTLKFIRFLAVPIIKHFPALTDLYDETCLVENPYFYVSDMDCGPCDTVFTVLNITKVDESFIKPGCGTPFITKSNQSLVSVKTLLDIYNKNEKILNFETRRLKSTNSSYTNLKDLFTNNVEFPSNTHILWRINKIATARIIRKVFPKPSFLPERSGQSVERFLMIDGSKAEPYTLPNTECSYVFVVQGSGEKNIVLKPSRECSNNCKTVSVVLKPSYVLWYNWWYWRPISFPVANSSETSVTYINSYC